MITLTLDVVLELPRPRKPKVIFSFIFYGVGRTHMEVFAVIFFTGRGSRLWQRRQVKKSSGWWRAVVLATSRQATNDNRIGRLIGFSVV